MVSWYHSQDGHKKERSVHVLLDNFPLIASLVSILVAQLVKIPIAYFSNSNRASLKLAVSTGGMPSSHSAAVSSLITALAIQYGMDSPYVAIATTFGVIIMFDAMGVRRQSGEQGIVIERLTEELENKKVIETLTFKDPDDDDDLDLREMIITKYLGHKPTEVFAGLFTGVLTAIILDFFIHHI
ncbi:divergent PAP2 family protein [Carnobacteriaceae bacterium zg-84]|uniref:divergent PAP2 family protein n=1 Tax=Granulicatella sp. zg-84 TaxID=2678503 RepID=UPI0013BF5B60|nr:divergent PAP2 family protein [Granulicatella sp. zg-84]NEW65612.1 divergent PAP2 family protein [Granulicatella sp. zg-84]QMI85747.1 divergent PAP2 family protein [Carnobacteriaceae bacterium zg-84]